MALTTERLLHDVADHVEGRLTDVVDTIMGSVTTLPGYSVGRRPGDTEDIRAGFLASSQLFLTCLRDDRAPSDQELAVVVQIGSQRARQGLPRESVSTSLDEAQRTGLRFVLDAVHEVATQDQTHGLALDACDRLGDFMTQVRSALLDGYDAVHGEPSTGPRREAALFVERLLGRRWTSEPEIRSHASSAGVVLGRFSCLLLLVPVTKASDQPLRQVADRLTARAQAVPGVFRWSPFLYLPVFVGNVDNEQWAHSSEIVRLCEEAGVSLVVVGPAASLWDLAASFVHSEPKLRHVPGARRAPTVVDSRELDLLHVLTGEATLTERIGFVKRVLGRVLADDRADELLAVLDAAYTTAGTATAVAAATHATKSTVLRRFHVIEQLTGRRLGVNAEQHELFTALRLHALLTRELQLVDTVRFVAE